jgi:transposase-like protein
MAVSRGWEEEERMTTQRKRYSAEFKAWLAFEALKGEQTLNELASEYGVHPTQIAQWKKHVQTEGPRLCAARAGKREEAEEALKAQLYQQIGQLKVELDWLKGMQIVNGGQTTASLYFTKRRYPEVDLSKVRVPSKIIVLKSRGSSDEEDLISDISRYANSQNAVRQSDLSANKPFHVALEKLSLSTYCPDGVGRWFYERAAGSYKVMLDREGSTPARLRQIREAIPNSRKITKTDLAKYLNAWDQEPHVVSLGAQKNFEKFMDKLSSPSGQGDAELPDVPSYKRMIARAILFKTAHSLIRSRFQAFQANITNYVVSLVANCLGARLELDRIWLQQGLSPQLQRQIQTWAVEVSDVLHRTANGRMVSEWAKKPECWEVVGKAHYSEPARDIPEVQ